LKVTDKIKEMKDPHDNAAALIVAAAAKSGLLKEIGEALLFINKYPTLNGDCCNCSCRACELYERLAEAFDVHCCLAQGVLASFHGDGVDLDSFTADELAPYLDGDVV
jgi:hypothetical protein